MSSLFRPLLQQSLKSSGIYLLLIALILAISATTALKFSNSQIQYAVALQAAEMLAGDLVLTDSEPLEEKWRQAATQLGLKHSEVTVFSSMAHTHDNFVMVNVKAIDDAFPLRGELLTQPRKQAIQSGEVWVSQRALELLGLKLGDQLNIADAAFRVTAVIEKDSNQETGFSGFSPTVMLSQADVAATNAIQVGSRIDYRLLMAGEPEAVQQYEDAFKALQPTSKSLEGMDNLSVEQNSLKLRNASDGNTRLMRPIENLDTFLQLANILTILLCGIAIALTSQRYVQQNQDHVALIRCMGGSKKQILTAYLALLAVTFVVAVILGSMVGIALGYGLLNLMLQLIPHLSIEFSILQMLFGPLPIAALTSAIVLLGFVLPSLLQLLNTPPIRVLRQQEKNIASMLWTLLMGVSSLVLFSLLLTGNIVLTALVIGAIVVLCVVLYLLVWVLLKALQKSKTRISAYVRTPYQTALQVTALALGLSLMSILAVLKTDLTERWQQQLPEGTPNQFLYGLPPFDLLDFQQQLAAEKWSGTPLYPNIRGRLIAKNDQPFSKELIRSNNSLRRELNLTQTEQFPKDNVITEGKPDFSEKLQVSVEANTAKELGIAVGDRLTFSLPEGNLTAEVINLRSVEWESFSPNFFFIFSPNSMDENAGSYLGSFYVPEQDQPKLVQLIQQFSNTVFIDVSLILQEIKRLIDVLVQIISVLALLVSVSGFLVLVACLNLLMDERKREVALLRAFGSAKAQLSRMMSIEIGLLGFLAGIVACIFAEVISAIVSVKMNIPMQLHWEIWFILPMLMLLICSVIGYYRLRYLADLSPLQSLREMN